MKKLKKLLKKNGKNVNKIIQNLMKKIAIVSLIILTLFSCEKQKNETIIEEKKSLIIESTETITETEIVFPKTGKKSKDFLPKSNTYEIQYETKGDLNNDNLIDVAIVLRNLKDKTAERPILILLQNDDRTFSLAKLSTIAMPEEFSDDNFKNYDSESIEIEDEVLQINLFGSGGLVGNLFSHYKFI